MTFLIFLEPIQARLMLCSLCLITPPLNIHIVNFLASLRSALNVLCREYLPGHLLLNCVFCHSLSCFIFLHNTEFVMLMWFVFSLLFSLTKIQVPWRQRHACFAHIIFISRAKKSAWHIIDELENICQIIEWMHSKFSSKAVSCTVFPKARCLRQKVSS